MINLSLNLFKTYLVKLRLNRFKISLNLVEFSFDLRLSIFMVKLIDCKSVDLWSQYDN